MFPLLFLSCPTAGPGLFSRGPREALPPPPLLSASELEEGAQRSEFFILFFFDSCSSIYSVGIFLPGVDFFLFLGAAMIDTSSCGGATTLRPPAGLSRPPPARAGGALGEPLLA